MSKTTGLIPRIKVVNAVDGQLFCLCDDCGGILSIHLNNFEAEYREAQPGGLQVRRPAAGGQIPV